MGPVDLRRIFAVQALRALVYGFGSILIGAELAAGGYSPAKAALVFTAMLAGFAVMSTVIRQPLPRIEYPSRRCYLLARRIT